MKTGDLIARLKNNRKVFKELLKGITKEQYLWKSKPDIWCPLEVVCHLYDEEKDDFRARVRHVLETPEKPMPGIDPQAWVEDHKYMSQDYSARLQDFLRERKASVEWLQSLQSPKWKNAYQHPKFGAMSAEMFLTNWLAHDYLHIRQILKLKYDYLEAHSEVPLLYAGKW